MNFPCVEKTPTFFCILFLLKRVVGGGIRAAIDSVSRQLIWSKNRLEDDYFSMFHFHFNISADKKLW